MTYSITKQFKFEAAHRLYSPYEGNCANIHGHSYTVDVCISPSDSKGLDEVGFVLDTKALWPIKERLDALFDHATILHQADPAVKLLRTDLGVKVTALKENPTSENMAEEIWSIISHFLLCEDWGLGSCMLYVTVNETATISATYSGLLT